MSVDTVLPNGWTWTTVENIGVTDDQSVLTGPFGSNLGRDDFVSQGVPVLTIGCLTDSGLSLSKAFYISAAKAEELERYRVRSGDILFSRMASVGRADLVSAPFEGAIINYHLMRLRLTPEVIEPRYFIYFVRGSGVVSRYVGEVNHGATRDGINTSQLLSMPIALPPLAEQRRIVAAIEEQFTRLDAGVAALKSARARLKQYRAAVLKAAVEGELTKAWRKAHPNTEPASELLARLLIESPDRDGAKARKKQSNDEYYIYGAALET